MLESTKLLKDWLKIQATKKRREKYCSIIRDERISASKREDLLQWLSEILEECPPEIVRNAFIGSRFHHESGVEYRGEAESESDDD